MMFGNQRTFSAEGDESPGSGLNQTKGDGAWESNMNFQSWKLLRMFRKSSQSRSTAIKLDASKRSPTLEYLSSSVGSSLTILKSSCVVDNGCPRNGIVVHSSCARNVFRRFRIELIN